MSRQRMLTSERLSIEQRLLSLEREKTRLLHSNNTVIKAEGKESVERTRRYGKTNEST
jgi:hypothetical protein